MQVEVRVNLPDRRLDMGGIPIRLTPVQLLIYTTFLRLKTDHCDWPDRLYCLECSDCFKTLLTLKKNPFLQEMGRDYSEIYSARPLKGKEWLDKWTKEAGLDNTIRQNISKIKGIIKRALGDETLLPYYSITNNRAYGGARYGVRVEKGKIRIE